MNSDEEYLDDLLKSVMENDEESSHLPEENNLADNIKIDEDMSVDDLDFMMDNDTVQSDLDMAITDESSGLDEFAITDEDSGLDEFAITDEGSGLDEFAITDVESELNDFAIMDEGSESDDLAITDVESELNDFAIMDEGSESDDLAVTDVESELNDFAIMDEGSELNDFAITDVESELNDFAIIDEDSVSSDLDLAIEDNGDYTEDISDDASSYEEELISPDEIDAMFAAANAAALDEASPNDSMEEDDMLALLDSMSEEKELDEDALLGDIAAGIEENESVREEAVPESETEKEKKGLLAKIFGGKKKANKGEKEADDSLHMTIDGEGDSSKDETSMEKLPKKQNFFSRALAFLTEADDDQSDTEPGMEPSDENKNILEELDKEDKKKKKKKVKGKNQDDGEEEEVEVEDKKKAKKEKKSKKREKTEAAAESDPLTPVKRGKRVSKKSIAVIIGLCMTLTAVIIVLCSIVPTFFDKRGAREAYYHSDYTKAYELLYGKKLDSSDMIIYNKSKIILELNRKLDSYHNYLGMGKEVQALDALMSGVEKYPDILLEAEEYHVTQEVGAIYETILNILNDKYNLSETMAKVIIAYDDLTYTRKLESIVYGTPFVKPEEENAETVETPAAADVLPEEQDLMDENTSIGTQEVESAEPEVTESTVTSEEVNDVDDTVDINEVNVQEEMENDTVQEEEMPSENTSDTVPFEPQDNSSDSQGELIQGIRQPINIEIHGN